MFAWLRLAWICLLAVALPVQGTLAATAVHCATHGRDGSQLSSAHASLHARDDRASLHAHTAHAAHSSHAGSHAHLAAHGHGPAASASHEDHRSVAHAHAVVGGDLDGADTAQADGPSASGCSVCAACCAGAGLPAPLIIFAAQPAAAAPPLQPEPQAPAFLTAAPERPPRPAAT